MNNPIPDSALDDRLAFVGTTGSGKTYSAGTCVERLLDKGARVVIIDPLDVWFGLRLSANGLSPSHYALPIFGGAHGDLPLNENAGALIGEAVAGMAESCIVSLGSLTTKSAERRFMLAFLDAIYRKANGEPVHLIFDEADLWAPQKASEPLLQSRMEEICRRGRVKGLIAWLISQRPAVISKDVLSQVSGLVAFKLTSSQDRDALEGWIEGQADRQQWKEIRAALPTLQQGNGVIWIPARGVLKTAAFPKKTTFDSSASPERGQARRSATLKPLDISSLKTKLAMVETETKANDPKSLKAEIAELKAQIRKSQNNTIDQKAIEQAAQDGHSRGYAEGLRAGIERAINAVKNALNEAPLITPRAAVPVKTVQVAVAPKVIARAPATVSSSLTSSQQKIVNSVAWWQSVGIQSPKRVQVAFVAGYKPGSGNFNNLLSQLSTAGLIEYPRPGLIFLTDAGSAVASPDSISHHSPSEAARAILNGPQTKLFDQAIRAYPDSLTREQLASDAGYSAGSGNFNNLCSSLSSLEIIEYPERGVVRAADWLFDGA